MRKENRLHMHDTQNSLPDLTRKTTLKKHHRQGWGPCEYLGVQLVCDGCSVSGSQHHLGGA